MYSSPYKCGNFSVMPVKRVVCTKNCRRWLVAAYINAMEIDNTVKYAKMAQDEKKLYSNRHNLAIGTSHKM
jgi:hypothetical protein